jgi:hypothetical protein
VFIDANVQPWHPLTEGYEFTSFCNANRVYMCLFQYIIPIRCGGTSSVTPSVQFLIYKYHCILAVEPSAQLSSQITAFTFSCSKSSSGTLEAMLQCAHTPKTPLIIFHYF